MLTLHNVLAIEPPKIGTKLIKKNYISGVLSYENSTKKELIPFNQYHPTALLKSISKHWPDEPKLGQSWLIEGITETLHIDTLFSLNGKAMVAF